MAAIYNAMNPDLSRFKARGGKLLMYHGLADPIVTPQNTLDYYAAAEKAAGGSVSDYFRLFMIPALLSARRDLNIRTILPGHWVSLGWLRRR